MLGPEDSYMETSPAGPEYILHAYTELLGFFHLNFSRKVGGNCKLEVLTYLKCFWGQESRFEKLVKALLLGATHDFIKEFQAR